MNVIPEQRADAARLARDVLAYLDHDAEDVIAVADWLLTGRCDVAVAISEQRARNYARNGQAGPSPDAMVWTPDLDGTPYQIPGEATP